MSGFWDKVKTKAVSGVQKAKEKMGVSETDHDPEYAAARVHFHLLKDRICVFTEDVESLLAIIADFHEGAVSVTTALNSVNENLSEESRRIAVAFERLYTVTRACVKESVIPTCNETIVKRLHVLRQEFRDIKKLKKARRECELHFNFTRDQLEKLSKAKNTSAEKLADLRVTYDQAGVDFAAKGAEFVNAIGVMWERRFALVEDLFEQLIGQVFAFSRKAYDEMIVVRDVVPTELLQRDYVVTDTTGK